MHVCIGQSLLQPKFVGHVCRPYYFGLGCAAEVIVQQPCVTSPFSCHVLVSTSVLVPDFLDLTA